METSATALPPPDGPGPLPSPPLPAPQQARSDEHLVALWLHGRSAGTRRACAADLAAFFAHARRPLHAVTPGDLQAFQDTLASLASATQARRLSASNQLLPFGHKRPSPVIVGAAIRPPKIKQVLAKRYGAGSEPTRRPRPVPLLSAAAPFSRAGFEHGCRSGRPCSFLDFLVAFEELPSAAYADACFGLRGGLVALFGRAVDRVTEPALENPCLRRQLEARRQRLFPPG